VHYPMALQANPSVLFMDEPTSGGLRGYVVSGVVGFGGRWICGMALSGSSARGLSAACCGGNPRPSIPAGLDARAAATVMRSMRNVGDAGRTIIVTIHQPSIDIFESFDRWAAGGLGGWEGWGAYCWSGSRNAKWRGLSGSPAAPSSAPPSLPPQAPAHPARRPHHLLRRPGPRQLPPAGLPAGRAG
jgi:hypothetical protein